MFGFKSKNHPLYQKIAIFVFALIVILLVGVLRTMTGPEYALSLLFFFPIMATCWFVNEKAGYLLAVISVAIWLLADLTFITRFSHEMVPIINESFRLIVFLSGVTLLSRLKKAIAREKMIAMTDPLTGIFNRRAFENMALLELNRFRRFNIPFSVIFFDIDNFKGVNDNYGHHTGDQLLKSVAQIVKKNIRSIDTFSRLGGDEFILILSGARKDLAYAGARKIRNVLQSEMLIQGWPVTFSIGVVIFSTPPTDLAQLFNTADAAMYAAKQNGKNQDEYREFFN